MTRCTDIPMPRSGMTRFPANSLAAALILPDKATRTPGVLPPMADTIQGEKQYIHAFFKLTLKPTAAADLFPLLTSLAQEQRQDFLELADSNHVVVRVFEVINRIAGNRGNHDLQEIGRASC